MNSVLVRKSKFVGRDGDNPQVSTISKFHDDVWDFSQENLNPSSGRSAKRLRWNFETPDGSSFTSHRYRPMMIAFKQFIFALRWHPIDATPLSASTLISVFGHTKRFVVHLLKYPNPVLRFRDVLAHHCDDYTGDLMRSSFNIGYKYHCLNALEKLFAYRHVTQNGIAIDPLNGETCGRVVGWDIASLLEAQTAVIPDETLGPLVRASIEYIDRFAGYLLDVGEAVEGARRPGRRLDACSAGCLQQHSPLAYRLDGTKFEEGIASLRELNKELCYLQTACFVIIAFSTGMRVSEILSLNEGCCEIQAEQGRPDLVWLHSRVFKMQGVPKGRKAKWIGGPVSARAVTVLERLTRSTRRGTKVRSLWVPIAALLLKPRDAGALKGDTIRYRLDVFVAMLGLKDSSGNPFHLHPHMFRRTFARHVARHDTTNLLALKEHFKHLSLAMTDLYVGSDVELWQLMVAEEEELLFESFEKALSAERMAGPGGSKLKMKIDVAITEGRLPKEFRGEAGQHLRKKMIRDLVESGQRIYPCAASNYCWFRPEFALCTQEDHPLLKRCNPGACSNSIITLEHKPHWEKILSDCETLMKVKPKAEPYQRALRDIHAVSRKVLRGLS